MNTAAYLHLPVGQTPPSLEGHPPFKAVLVIEQSADEAWRALVSEWLVRSGCLYMSVWGHDCKTWHDRVDLANLSACDCGDMPDDAFVMTTWHAHEPLTEALWSAVNCAEHPTMALDHTIIIHISADERRAELLNDCRKAYEKDG